MNETERAEEHLRTIRRLMERGTIYRAISAPVALVGGLLSLAACGIQWLRFANGHEPGYGFLILWLLVLAATGATNTLFIVLGARKRGEPAFSPSMKAAFAALAPPLIVGAVITIAFSESTSNPNADCFLGTNWAVCYGLGLLATSHFAPRSLTMLGWAFLVAGLGAWLCFRFAGDAFFNDVGDQLAVLFMGGTFGLFHLIYAACAWPRDGAEPER
jgi:hypothetical protein